MQNFCSSSYPKMFGRKAESLENENTIGKLIFSGCLLGSAIEAVSSKKTRYSSYFAAKLAIIGCGMYAGRKIIRLLVKRSN